MRKILAIGVTIAVSAACLLAAEAKKGEFSTPAARGAKTQFATKVDKAEREYQLKLTAARREYIADLDRAKADATRANDLDEAIRIRDVLDEQKKEDASATAGAHGKSGDAVAVLRAKVAGTVWAFPGGGKLTFSADGTIARGDSWVGHWNAVDAKTVVCVYANNVIDSFTFDDQFKKLEGIGHPADNKFAANRAP